MAALLQEDEDAPGVFAPIRTNRVLQPTTVQTVGHSRILVVASGPGSDVYHLDSIENGLVYPGTFSMKYLGQVSHTSAVVENVAVKFCSKPGVLVSARLYTTVPRVDIVVHYVRLNPLVGLVRPEVGTDNSPLRSSKIANGSFFFPRTSPSSAYLTVHPSESFVVLCTLTSSGGRLDWMDFCEETLLESGADTGSFENVSEIVARCEFSPEGNFLVCADTSGYVSIWKYLSATHEIEKFVQLASGNEVLSNAVSPAFLPTSLVWAPSSCQEKIRFKSERRKETIMCGNATGSVVTWAIHRLAGSDGVESIEKTSGEIAFYSNVHGPKNVEIISYTCVSDGIMQGENVLAASFAASSTRNFSILRLWPFCRDKEKGGTQISTLFRGSPRSVHLLNSPNLPDALAARFMSASGHQDRTNIEESSLIVLAVTDEGMTIKCFPSSTLFLSKRDRRPQTKETVAPSVIEMAKPTVELNKPAKKSFAKRFRLPQLTEKTETYKKSDTAAEDHSVRLVQLNHRVQSMEAELQEIKASFHLFTSEVNQQLGLILATLKRASSVEDDAVE